MRIGVIFPGSVKKCGLGVKEWVDANDSGKKEVGRDQPSQELNLDASQEDRTVCSGSPNEDRERPLTTLDSHFFFPRCVGLSETRLVVSYIFLYLPPRGTLGPLADNPVLGEPQVLHQLFFFFLALYELPEKTLLDERQ